MLPNSTSYWGVHDFVGIQMSWRSGGLTELLDATSLLSLHIATTNERPVEYFSNNCGPLKVDTVLWWLFPSNLNMLLSFETGLIAEGCVCTKWEPPP